MKRSTSVVVAVLIVSCFGPDNGRSARARAEGAPPGSPARQGHEARDLEVYEAVFRHQFEHNASGMQQKAKGYFLTIAGGDPAPEFLARFRENRPPVAAGSRFREGEGLLFRIDGLRWIDEGTA